MTVAATHMTIQELVALDEPAQAAAAALITEVHQMEMERDGVRSRLDATGLDDDMMHAAGARERLLRLDAAIQERTAQRNAAQLRANQTAADLTAARVELDRAERWIADLRTAISPLSQQLSIRAWRNELERCQEVIQRRTGQRIELPSVPPETDGTQWQATTDLTVVSPPELVA